MFYGKKEISPKEHMVLLMVFNNVPIPVAKYAEEIKNLTAAKFLDPLPEGAKKCTITKKGQAFCHTQCTTTLTVDDIVKHPSTIFKRKVADALGKTLAIEEKFNELVEKNRKPAS